MNTKTDIYDVCLKVMYGICIIGCVGFAKKGIMELLGK